MTAAPALDVARAFFADEGAPFPPVPAGFRVERAGPHEWGCGGPDARAIEREAFVQWLQAQPEAKFVRFGIDGYSTPAVSFHAAVGAAAVVFQERWGGFEWDIAAAAEELRATWTRVESFLGRTSGPRVIVVSTPFDVTARYSVVTGDGEVDWRPATRDTVFEEAGGAR